MENKVYVRLDADNIGDKIELALLNNDVENAARIHLTVQFGMDVLFENIKKNNCEILMRGSDDILFTMEKVSNVNFLNTLRSLFYEATGCTISLGVGETLDEALKNLLIAKMSGRDKIVETPNE